MMAERHGPLAARRTSRSSGSRPRPTSTSSRAVAQENERDERLVALAEVRDLTPVRDEDGRVAALPDLERMVREAFEAMRSAQSRRPARRRLLWNRLVLYIWPTIDFGPEEAGARSSRASRARPPALGLEMVHAARPHADRRRERERALRIFNPAGRGLVVEVGDPPTQPLQPLDEGAQRIVSARRRGTLHPAEIVKILAPARRDPRRVRRVRPRRRRRQLVPVDRPRGDQHGERRASASSATAPSATPRGCSASIAARRPDALARLARRARVPAHHRRARPRRAARRAARVVRALLGREDRDGLRHREHGLGRGRAAADRASSRRRAARSTSSSAASTSARSRTSTPRRRCSCTRAASS